MNIYSWLKDHAGRRPEKVCLKFKDERMTFRELYRLTDSLGTALRKAGELLKTWTRMMSQP